MGRNGVRAGSVGHLAGMLCEGSWSNTVVMGMFMEMGMEGFVGVMMGTK